MASGFPSLGKSIKTCKVDTALASRFECPVWNGRDNLGRKVCEHSFNNKNRGCSSAMDIVETENNVSRPQYMEYITLSTHGIDGEKMYSETDTYDSNAKKHSIDRSQYMDGIQNITGSFGTQFSASVDRLCGGNQPYMAYDDYEKEHKNSHGHR
jgi:hypothetical protein